MRWSRKGTCNVGTDSLQKGDEGVGHFVAAPGLERSGVVATGVIGVGVGVVGSDLVGTGEAGSIKQYTCIRSRFNRSRNRSTWCNGSLFDRGLQ
jgi:hypothetical protein